jgi:pyruvate/2-oxoglutarate/acetoin dehydrogenase E1 component
VREITYRQAVNEALDEEMQRDPMFSCWEKKLLNTTAPTRSARTARTSWDPSVCSTRRLAKAGLLAGIGAAMVAAPVVEFMTFSRLRWLDQVVNNAPNMLTMSGGNSIFLSFFGVPMGPPTSWEQRISRY